ncbi:MAG TPA: phosphoadenylyl-sulfate reductase [Sandaracinaceae bacterium LLY-WYZ-13_1]|nr:phosphoadenylyl-sulfate reductase [Sandaracinaceae bacterium LLY-WYZ-13_1]
MEALKLVPPTSPSDGEELDLDAAAAALADADAEEVVRWAAETFGDRLVMTSSFGAHSAVMLHLVTRVVPKVPVVFLDTGYLFPETYQFAESLRERFGLRLEVYSPRMTAARQEALYGRLYDGDDEELARYQQINKVEPMQRALRELGAAGWIAGLRGGQTDFRAGLRKVERQDGVVKIHPILRWTRQDVADYLELYDLPHHPLYAWGYRSIGDTHSTVPVDPSEMDDRAGRRLGEKRECGIHLPRSPEEDASLKSSGL